MLARHSRLSKSRDIAHVMQRGRWYVSGPLTIKALRTANPVSRGVVVVSKKVAKRATIRNRIRRRLTAMLHSRWETVNPGYDIVIIVRSDVSEVPADELEQHITAAARNVHILKTT